MPFDPFTQNITLTASDGSTMNVSIPEFDEYVQEGVVSCINYGTQLGATMVTFVLLSLLTRAKKRSSIVFCLNILALFFNMFRLICQVMNYTGAFFEAYSYFSGDVSHASQGDFADSVLVQVANSLVETVMEASLVTQTRVVTTNMLRWQKLTVLAISVALAVVNVGFRLAQMAWCSVLIMRAQSFYPVLWLQKVNTVLMTVSICYFSVVLMGKLGYTIYRRRQLGVRQFGPMQIIFVMSCQTMIVPAIFSVLQFSSVNIHHINNDIVTFVVVSLPITTLWASTAVPGHASAQDLESGVPLWAKLSSARLDSIDSRQSRKKSVATSDTLPTFPSELNFHGSDPDRSCNKGVHLVESTRG